MCNATWNCQAFRGNKTSLKLSTDSPCLYMSSCFSPSRSCILSSLAATSCISWLILPSILTHFPRSTRNQAQRSRCSDVHTHKQADAFCRPAQTLPCQDFSVASSYIMHQQRLKNKGWPLEKRNKKGYNWTIMHFYPCATRSFILLVL